MLKNKLLIIALLAVALVAIAGFADAKPILFVDVNSINQNGHYYGEPVLLGDAPGHIGYNYTFVPDGTYTIYGTITNIDSKDYTVFVSYNLITGSGWITVPAESKADFSFTVNADSYETVLDGLWWEVDGTKITGGVGTSNMKETQSVDTGHTFDEGPMSGQVAIYKDGKITYSGAPLFVLDFAY